LPTWSPDGSEIAFQRATSGGTDIYVIHANGTASSAQPVGLGYDPTWGGAMSSGGGGNGVPDTRLSSRKIDRRHHRAKFVF
jgi:hypothetical protein